MPAQSVGDIESASSMFLIPARLRSGIPAFPPVTLSRRIFRAYLALPTLLPRGNRPYGGLAVREHLDRR